MCIWRSTTNPSINCPNFALKYDLISTAFTIQNTSTTFPKRLSIPALDVTIVHPTFPSFSPPNRSAQKCGMRIQCRSSSRPYGSSDTALVAQHNSNAHHARKPVPRSHYVSTQHLSLSDTPDQACSPLLRGTDAPVVSDIGARSILGLDAEQTKQITRDDMFLFWCLFSIEVVRLRLIIIQNLVV